MAEKKRKPVKNSQEKRLKQLKPIHRKCINLLVPGDMTDTMVADYIGVAPETLSRWRRSEVFREELEKRIAEEERYRRLKYRAQANRAAERLAELVESRHPTTAIAAVREMLRLAGDGPHTEAAPEDNEGVIILPAQDIK